MPEGLELPLAVRGPHRDGKTTTLPPALRVKGVDLYYGAFQALRYISIDIPRTSVTAVIGPSGCGKSSFLRLFNRMNDLIPTAQVKGTVELEGVDIYAPQVDVVELRKQVGMVFQRPNPFPMSIFDNVAYGPRRQGGKGRSKIADIVERTLRRAALWEEVYDKLDKSALHLSGGQQQRLCIARSLAVDPAVILMDEPCSALDPLATLRIEDLMRDLAREYTILIVTHNMQQAARVSDQTAVMMMAEDRAGGLVEFSSTQEIFTNPQKEETERYITGRVG